MRVDVYSGDDLAAVFEYGQPPSYYGEAGRWVRELVNRPHCVHNLWTGESSFTPPEGRPDWWAATILSAGLTSQGFKVSISTPVVAPSWLPPRPTPPAGLPILHPAILR